MKYPPHIWQAAFDRVPLPRLLTHLLDGKFRKKSGPCPFCHAKDCFGIYEKPNGHYHFKCHKPGCLANDPPSSCGEVAYIMLRKQLSEDDAKNEYLKLAVPHLVEQYEPEQRKRKEGDAQCNVAPIAAGKMEDIQQPAATGDTGAEGSSPPTGSAPPHPPPENVVPFNAGPTPSQKRNPWHALFTRLVLTKRDRKKLHDRGLSDETIDKLGFKSNNQSNRIHIESLKKEFPMELLLETGIFKNYRVGPAPNVQLLGKGIKRRAKKEGEEDEWDWTEPILIPYLDEHGTCFHLRPHKGEISPGRDEEDDDDQRPRCSSHVYCPFLLANTHATIEGTVVLTEGEFKAAALFQCGILALAIPGISFVRNQAFCAELIGIIRKFAITDLAIIFDNEVKDDPGFPSRYKADPDDRYDTQMWAEYIAIDLGTIHFGPHRGHIRIGILPDNLREDGKVDFDSALSYFVRQWRDVAKGTDAARKVFAKAIEDAPTATSARAFPFGIAAHCRTQT